MNVVYYSYNREKDEIMKFIPYLAKVKTADLGVGTVIDKDEGTVLVEFHKDENVSMGWHIYTVDEVTVIGDTK